MPLQSAPPKIKHRAAELRHHQTKAEAELWAHLRAHRLGEVHFRRQFAIGNYIADFCAPRKKLIIEVDGSQHLAQKEYDAQRTAYLEEQGYRVLRFWNSNILNDIEGVLEVISLAIAEEAPSNLPHFKNGNGGGLDS